MEPVPTGRGVVGGNGLDADPQRLSLFAIGKDFHADLALQCLGDLLRHTLGGDDRSANARGQELGQRGCLEVVEVEMGEQDEVGLGQIGERLGAAHRINIDRLAIPLEEKAGVADRMYDQVALAGWNAIAGQPRVLGPTTDR